MPRPTVPPPTKHQLALMIWVAVVPTLVVLNLTLGSMLRGEPIVLRTFVIATVAVPIVIYGVMSQLHPPPRPAAHATAPVMTPQTVGCATTMSSASASTDDTPESSHGHRQFPVRQSARVQTASVIGRLGGAPAVMAVAERPRRWPSRRQRGQYLVRWGPCDAITVVR